ncbi:MAG: 2-oxoglutarate oxidoreductase subunit KorB [Syntrophorhabdaceae bacterium PtaU1.Bin034]|nr:MAG: 2-oxoglutarate oxidoreductase subunit KorB [Syntrophorhabdaceae bacterium PtaU1.Bin034]
MPDLRDYEGPAPAWCPGCGNFGILRAFRQAVVDLGLEPHQFIVVSGIGQAGKFPHYTKCNTFNGLHGRTLPVATGIRLVNHKIPVIAVAGDGDCYGEGGNHLIHAIRRNIDVKIFVHDNQVYGLTKGQASPTSMEGVKTKIQPYGVLSEPVNPLALAVALDCSFVGRSFAGDPEHLTSMMKEAINHKGFALLDIFQPCVTYNKLNTYAWFKQRVYPLDNSYDPTDRIAAFAKALEFGDRIPIGVIYRNDRAPLEEKFPVLADRPVVDRPFDPSLLSDITREFY